MKIDVLRNLEYLLGASLRKYQPGYWMLHSFNIV
jgi:hypothetical protein